MVDNFVRVRPTFPIRDSKAPLCEIQNGCATYSTLYLLDGRFRSLEAFTMAI